MTEIIKTDFRNSFYRLVGHDVVPCTLQEYAADTIKDFRSRRVAYDELEGVKVSTVFLGLNHQFGDGSPLLFETMIFGGKFDQKQARYSTWDEAVEGHTIALEHLKAQKDFKNVNKVLLEWIALLAVAVGLILLYTLMKKHQ